MAVERLVRSRERVAAHGEVFTPRWLVDELLDLVGRDTGRIGARFLEPACGSGNFLVPILLRKLAVAQARHARDAIGRRRAALEALMSVYGIELLADNVHECRAALRDAFVRFVDAVPGDAWSAAADEVLAANIVHGDALAMRTIAGGRIVFPEWSIDGGGDGYGRRDVGFDELLQRGAAAVPEPGLRFDVVIGNPPYQLDGGGDGMGSSPIYQHFVRQAKALDPSLLVLVIPSRWMAGGKGLDRFRREMLSDRRIRSLVDYPDAADVFGEGVRIKGGVCCLLWDREWSGPTSVTTVRGRRATGPVDRDLGRFDVFVREVESVRILEKVLAAGEPPVRGMLGADFGLDTNFRGFRPVREPGDLELHVNVGGMGHRRAIRFVSGERVTRSRHLIPSWKVLVPKAAGYGSQRVPDRVLGQPIVAGPHAVCTRTYRGFAPFGSQAAARSFESYYRTRLFRFLVSLRKITQDAAPKVYDWVPEQVWDREWTDDALYRKYGITEEEIAFLESRVRPLPARLFTLGAPRPRTRAAVADAARAGLRRRSRGHRRSRPASRTGSPWPGRSSAPTGSRRSRPPARSGV